MTDEYIKQLEEANEIIRNRLEYFEARCEWLEQLRLLRTTLLWSGNSIYSIGINNYKSPDFGKNDVLYFPDDKKISDIMIYIQEEIVRCYSFSLDGMCKIDMRNEYSNWRYSIMLFVSYAKTVFESSDYEGINKLSLTTSAHISLTRWLPESEVKDNEPPENPLNEKDILQGVTITITKSAPLPIVRVSLKKTIDGFPNNLKFMEFGKQARFLKDIYKEVEKLKTDDAAMVRRYLNDGI